MNLHGDVVDFPYSRNYDGARRPRARVSAWILVALIGVVLGGAAIAVSLTTDTRDFATRHGTVLATQAL